MKTTYKFALLLFLAVFAFQSCQDNDDLGPPASLEVQNFIWKGLNQYYLWQEDVPNLSDDRFENQAELNSFLAGYPAPENLFQNLLLKPISLYPNPEEAIDRFSWIVSDYLALEQMLQGTTKNNGVDYELRYKTVNSEAIFGWVRYILPNSDASNKDIRRGDIFYGINGTPLTVSNYKTLLKNDSYTLNLANYDNGSITPNGRSVTLTKTTLSENPILINSVLNSGTHKIGYLMYNGFYADYDKKLNDVFGSLKSAGITDLVLDLRYNSGGSVSTATYLASMITGQFKNQIFANQQWNSKINPIFEAQNPEYLKNKFTDNIDNTPINSLNLTKIYILTSKSSASASELVINGLRPYINVIQIGDITTGKNVGSVTLYDSKYFGNQNRNPNHKYAMQPIVLKLANAVGFGDYSRGLIPNYELKEDMGNLGVLGNDTEALLSTAIGKITGTNRMIKQNPAIDFEYFKDVKSINGFQNQMYIDKLPETILKALE
jgi:carboxyl-terminal processing protease